nr:glycosyltransferase [uncultured Acetatifactor sp.]
MLHIRNCSLNAFKENIRGKKLFIWGGGNRAELCYREWGIKWSITAIVDSNENLWNKRWHVDNEILCIDKKRMISDICTHGINNCVLLITSVFYAMDIIEELDEVVELDGLKTYVVSLISEYYVPQNFEFTKGVQKIPKKIHYFWFGGKEIPEKFKHYIETWEQFCPDYDIVRWNESNYDITKNQYMYEAYQAGKYGFVPDYARLDIIYNHGGIYLDTDIELCKNFDDLLCDDGFFSVDFEGCVNTGSGFGAIQYNPIIRDMMGAYENEHFIDKDRNMNLKPCHHYQNPILKKAGFEITQKYQKIDGNVLYPCEVLAPIATYSGIERITEKTHSIHCAELSWISDSEREARERFRNRIGSRINRKLPGET